MVDAFWIVAALDAAGMLAVLLLGWNEKGRHDGGREMGLLFFILLPLLVLGVACGAFALFPNPAVRWLCLALVALPAAFYAFVGVSQFGLRFVNDPSGGFANPAMRKTVRAVSRLDVEEVRRWAPQMDKDIDQLRVDAPLRIVIESMVAETKRHLPPQTDRHLEIARILLANGAKPDEVLEIACWTRSGPLLRAMFEAGADPDYVNQYGGSAFLGCLGRGVTVGSSLEVAKAFVEAGANYKDRTPYGTPVSFAVNCDSFDIALYLLEKGVDPNSEQLRNEVKAKLREHKQSLPPDLLELAARTGIPVARS